MYEREFSIPTGERPVRRRGRGRQEERLPLAMLLLALLSFAMALIFSAPPEEGGNKRASDAGTRYVSSRAVSRGEEPVLPDRGEGASPSEDGSPEDWNLRLVNPWTSLPEDYNVTLTQLSNGHAVDARCYADLQMMMDDCRAAGLSPLICSSYRSYEKQEQLYQNKVDRLVARGLSQAAAQSQAAQEVALPGTSEHQLGLAVDIVDVNNQNLDSSQESTEVQKWLMEHCWEYGFILRYPNDKSERTGIIYEPWHYRYVGREAAQEIQDQGVCLEEYLENLSV